MWSSRPSLRAREADSSISLPVTENGEQGATAIWTRAPGAGLVQRRRQPLGVREHGIEVLDQLVRREAAVRLAEVHRAARRDQPQPELSRRLHFRLDQPRATAREDVVVVEDGRAARQRELREAGARGRVLGLGIDAGPDRIQGPQPGEEIGFGSVGSGQRLVEVVVSVDEPGRDERAAQVDT